MKTRVACFHPVLFSPSVDDCRGVKFIDEPLNPSPSESQWFRAPTSDEGVCLVKSWYFGVPAPTTVGT